MDATRDFPKFKRLIARLCDTLGKPPSDELMDSWWRALRHVDYGVVEAHVDRFLAKATDATPFPRPAQMRPQDMPAPDPEKPAGNPVRDYWRSAIVHSARSALYLDLADFQKLVLAHRDSLGQELRSLLDELCDQDFRSPERTIGMLRHCDSSARRIARRYDDMKAAA